MRRTSNQKSRGRQKFLGRAVIIGFLFFVALFSILHREQRPSATKFPTSSVLTSSELPAKTITLPTNVTQDSDEMNNLDPYAPFRDGKAADPQGFASWTYFENAQLSTEGQLGPTEPGSAPDVQAAPDATDPYRDFR